MMQWKMVIASLLIITSTTFACVGIAVADQTIAKQTTRSVPTVNNQPRGRSPLSVFSSATVFFPTAFGNFSDYIKKKIIAGTLTQDTYIGDVFVPAGAYVQQAEYAPVCGTPDCISMYALTPQQIAQIHEDVLDRGNTVSRLDPQDYMAQRDSSMRHVWRWSFLGDGLPLASEEADLYRAAGVSIIPTLVADNPIYHDPAYLGNEPCMTADFTDTFDPAFGYSPIYFNWVTQLVTEYADIMPIIVIENEVNQDGNTWCEPVGVRDGYRKMVVTAKYAVRQAGVNVLVADSGIMGGTWIRLALVDLIAERAALVKLGQTLPAEMEQQILELISQIENAIPLMPDGTVDWITIENAAAILDSPTMQNAREIIRLLNADVIDPDLGEPALDVYNFHYHQTASALPAVVQYIRRVFATNNSPLICHELGILADQVKKTLAANNTTLLEFTEFLPLSNYYPTGEIERLGGVIAFDTFTPIQPRVERIATEDLVKKFMHSFGNGVSDVTYFDFNGSETETFLVAEGQSYDFFTYKGLNFSSCVTDDKIIVPQNFRAILNVRSLFDRRVLSSTHNVANPIESYTFELPHKTVSVWWVQAYVNNIGITSNVDVKSQIKAGSHFYDIGGFEITPRNGKIHVGLSPVFAETMHK